jgi:3-deoxy-manno-octulosonate cytidylyltransferase (CMP-KDO synthetase)
MSVIGIIPARYASTRFPGKPLADIQGKTMLRRVYEQVKKAKLLSDVVIATDDERIAEHVKTFNGEVVMTKTSHPSGTDRCYEALTKVGGKFEYFINIQGDEPFIRPEQIDALAKACKSPVQIATQMIRCTNKEQLFSPNTAKIVVNKNNEALYFSRHPIPFIRNLEQGSWAENFSYFRHIGMYAYRSDVLAELTRLQVSPLESAESLEQLRWLENGYKINCIETIFESHGVDVPDDIGKLNKMFPSK